MHQDETGADEELDERFEEHRSRLTAVAYRILGSTADAEHAVDTAQGRLQRLGQEDGDDPARPLTSAVARTCLALLRDRASHGHRTHHRASSDSTEPQDEAMLSETLAEALLAVGETLAPAERVAFVLHDLFATSYDEIATMLGRSPTAARQLAGRARRRVLAPERTSDADRTVHSRVVEAFLTASRHGDVEEMAWLVHPDAALRADRAAVATGADPVVVGADAVAAAVAGRAGTAEPALLDGFAAAAGSSGGTRIVIAFTVLDGRVAEIELIAEPAVLASLHLEAASATP